MAQVYGSERTFETETFLNWELKMHSFNCDHDLCYEESQYKVN